MKTLKTDVIIPAYRPGEEFEKLLERLSAQKYPINKILVMNTEKKFWKETWEQEYPLVEVRHLTKEEFDHGGTRRQAAELSDAEILVFMTQDAMPADRELIGALVGALAENPQAGAAYATGSKHISAPTSVLLMITGSMMRLVDFRSMLFLMKI